MELQKIKKRKRAAREARVARGDRFGHAAYGYKHVRDERGASCACLTLTST